MKKENLVTMAAIVCMVTISIFASKPSAGEVPTKISPNPTPSPRTKRPKTVQSPKPIQSQRTASGKPTSVGGSSTKADRTAIPTRKSPTSSGDQPELQLSPIRNGRKVKTNKDQAIEVENDETHLTNDPANREGGANNSMQVNQTRPASQMVTNDTSDKVKTTAVPRKTTTTRPSTRKVRKPKN